jgi:hypothetical protein
MGGVWPIFLSIFRPTQCQAVQTAPRSALFIAGELPPFTALPTAGVITVEPVRRTYRAPRNPVPWLELASADGPWRSGLHASTVILGSIVLTDALGRSSTAEAQNLLRYQAGV